jgi:hypothetical protein
MLSDPGVRDQNQNGIEDEDMIEIELADIGRVTNKFNQDEVETV